MTLRAFDLPAEAVAIGDRLQRDDVVSRIWGYDHTLWKPDPEEVANRLGWLHVTETMPEHLPRIERLVADVRGTGFERVVLLGMGGSSLAPSVFASAFGVQPGGLPLTVIDTTHPAAIRDIADDLDPARTLFLVATKSGTTTETLSLFRFFFRFVEESGAEHPGRAFVAITDPGSPLVDLAERHGFRETFLNDPNIGGRYAALSLFGLLPAALLGIDVERLLGSAAAFIGSEAHATSPEANTALHLGGILGALAAIGRDKVTFFLSETVAAFGAWVEQLIAESSGKRGVGILPVVGERPGVPDDYGSDRVFVQVRLVGDAALDGRVEPLMSAGGPVLIVDVDDVYDLGREFFRWEFATAVACHLLDVNAFAQPNVESAKRLARERLEAIRSGAESEGPVVKPLNVEAIAAFLRDAEPGDYIALHAYLPPSDELSSALAELQTAIRDRTMLATTLGYGPRFLHSTGQLHKGDCGNGHFIQLVSASMPELPIPNVTGDSGSDISFGQLITAQARGDRGALEDAGRGVLTLAVNEDAAAQIRRSASEL